MKSSLFRFSPLVLLLGLMACPKPPPTPLSDLIRYKWVAKEVKEGSTVVYTQGNASNIKPAYANFSLDFSNPAEQKVTLTEIVGPVITGTWAIGGNTLTLSNLNPSVSEPSGESSTLEYSFVEDPTPDKLHLRRSKASEKTGGTVNEYVLVPKQ